MRPASFEEEYFVSNYQGNYELRNPPYKWRSFLSQITKFRKTGSLLDIGCATGLFLKQAQRYYDCTGCDVSGYALTIAQQNLPGNIPLFQGRLGEICLGKRFDIITCFDVIEHIPNLELVWKNIHDLLNPRGYLVVTVPVYDGPLGGLVNRLDHDTSHVHRRERSFWLDQIGGHFKLRAFTGIWRFFLFNNFYLNLVSEHLRQYSPAVMLIAQKA